MADSFTEFLNLIRPEVGASRDAWGGKWNDNANVLDRWAKATDALVKETLQKAGVKVTDPTTGVVSYQQQNVEGPVRIGGKATIAGGAEIPRAAKLVLGMGYVWETKDYLEFILGTANQFRVVDTDYKVELFRTDKDGAYVANQKIWHVGNFDPANYLGRLATGQQQLSGPFSINMANPYFDLTYGNVMRLRQIVDGYGTWIVRNGDNNDNFFYVTKSGQVWTKELGDLNGRIEARGQAYRDDANKYYEDRAPVRSNLGSEQNMAGPINVNFANPYMRWTYPGISQWYAQLQSDKHFKIYADGTHVFQISPSGALWCKEFGGLNDRIEARGGAYRDDAVTKANKYYEDRAPLRTNVGGNQTITSDLEIQKADALLRLHYPGVRWWELKTESDGTLRFHANGEADRFKFNRDGSISTAQFGDLNDRIEARGDAYRNDAVTRANKYYEDRAPLRTNIGSEQAMAGPIKASFANPYFRWEYPGLSQWYAQIQSDKHFKVYADGAHVFQISPSGGLWCAEFGGLNDRIENRAADFANDRLNTATDRINNKSLKFVFAGDLENTWNYDGGFSEPYGGAFVTSRRTTTGGNGPTVTGMRWRYIQMSNSNGDYYAIGYS
jgi:hypothetical protein